MKPPISIASLIILLSAPVLSAQSAALPLITTFAGDTVGFAPSAWGQDLGGSPLVSDTEAAHGDNKSILFSENNKGIRMDFDPTSNFQCDFWVFLSQTGRTATFGTLDGAGRFGVWLTFGATPGKISYHANGVFTPIEGVTFVPNTWYRVRIVGRMGPNKSFDLFMSNGEDSFLPDIAQGRNLPLRDQNVGEFKIAKFGTYGMAPEGMAWVDNIVMQEPIADDFESNTVGVRIPNTWRSIGMTFPEIIASGTDGSQRSVRLTAITNRIERDFEFADEVNLDFKVRLSGTNRSGTITLLDSDRKAGPYISFGVSQGKVGYHTNGQWTHLSSPILQANAWYRVRIVARTLPSPDFDIYVGEPNSDTLPAAPQARNLSFKDQDAAGAQRQTAFDTDDDLKSTSCNGL